MYKLKYIRDEENLNPGNNLFVTGLSMRTGDRELEDIFSKYGKVYKLKFYFRYIQYIFFYFYLVDNVLKKKNAFYRS